MNSTMTGVLILLVPAMAVFAIVRNGRWRWRVLDESRGPYFLMVGLSVLFWIGFFGALLVGVLTLFDISP